MDYQKPHVYLVPISDKMRAVYSEYGFVNIPSSGKNEYEDYMAFNLLDEDPTLIIKTIVNIIEKCH